MIIQKAGCEILEKFTQEFASFLQSYGIKVKMTSSNDHVIDAEGGIASYLQNNIKSCDVVFIMITDDDGKIVFLIFEIIIWELLMETILNKVFIEAIIIKSSFSCMKNSNWNNNFK